MSAQPVPTVSAEEFLEMERIASFKSEYVNGQKGKPCRVFGSDLRVFVGSNSAFFYPDLTIVYEQPQFTDAHVDTLTNPLVVVEIASPSTAHYDRTVKRVKYSQMPSLREYVLVSQDAPFVEWFTLTEGIWQQ